MGQVEVLFSKNVHLRNVAHAVRESLGTDIPLHGFSSPEVVHDWERYRVCVRVMKEGQKTNAWECEITQDEEGYLVAVRENLKDLGLAIASFMVDAGFGKVLLWVDFVPPEGN